MNRFIVSSLCLASTLSKMKRVVKRNSILPQLECVFLEINYSKLILAVTDLETVLKKEVSIESKYIFSCVVDFYQLYNIVSNCEDQPISIIEEDMRVTVRGDNWEVSLKCEPVDNYPNIPVVDQIDSRRLLIPAKDLLPILRRSLLFVGDDDLRPAMTGVSVKIRGVHLHIAATDAHMLFWKKHYTSEMRVGDKLNNLSVVLSDKTVRVMLDSMKPSSTYHPLVIHFDDHDNFQCKFVRIQLESTVITSRLIDAKFPDYEIVIPTENNYRVAVRRKVFREMIKMVGSFAHKATNLIKMEITRDFVRCFSGADVISRDQIMVDTNKLELPAANYRIPAFDPQYPHSNFEDLTIGMNYKFLLDAVRDIENDEYVLIHHANSPNKALQIDDCVVVMPLMLND